MTGDFLTMAGHKSDGWGRFSGQEFRHIDVGLLLDFAGFDLVSLVAKAEGVANRQFVEILENCRWVADNKIVILIGMIDAGNTFWWNESVLVGNFEGADWWGEADFGYFEN